MAEVAIPKDHFDVGEKLVGYVNDWRESKWVNIRKTYTNKDGDSYIGKGLMLSIDDWNDLSANWKDMTEYLDKKLNNE